MDPKTREKYQLTVGLEIHAQLLTQSKVFAPDSTEYGEMPNTNISVITLAHPGALPKLNKRVLEFAMKMGLSCNSSITRENTFDRKNYFYPDLPKGYQITQDKTPICVGGEVHIKPKNEVERVVGLNRIHLEEDAGKSIHLDGETDTLVDYNRAGTPLIEIVTEPDIHTPEQAYALMSEIRRLVRYLEICDGNMEEGSLRCDANISVRPKNQDAFNKKVEVKNMNSIRNVQRAIEYEMDRQIEALENGETVVSETRTFDAEAGTTAAMRFKEELNDYRYFPEPDLSPVYVTDEWLNKLKEEIPSLPNELYHKFIEQYKLPVYDAEVLIDDKDIALYFEELCEHVPNYKAASNWIMGPVKSHLNDLTMHAKDFPVKPEKLAGLIQLVEDEKVSFSVASSKIFPDLAHNPDASPEKIAEEKNLIQDSSADTIQPIIEEVLEANPEKVKQYKNGKKGLLGMFVGEVMKKSQGKANPKVANEMIRKYLEEETV